MSFLGFDEAELYTNRSGRFSEKQKARLSTKESKEKTGSAAWGGLLIIVALIGVVIAVVLAPYIARDSLMGGILFGAAFGVLWPLAYGFIAWIILWRAFRKFEVQLKQVEGPVQFVQAQRKTYNTQTETYSTYLVTELHMGGRIFDVGSALPGYMSQGDVYAVYFADFGSSAKPKIFSAELVRKSDGKPLPPPTMDDADPEVLEYVRKGETLNAIRAHRALHNSSLEEARSAVEDVRVRLGV